MGISRQWELFYPDRDTAALAVLSVDFDARTGSLRYLRQQVPLTAFTQTGPGQYKANFNLDRFQGALAWQVLSDGTCDIDITGTWKGKLRGRPVPAGGPRAPLPGARAPSQLNPIRAGRSFAGFLATPTNTRGEVASGTLHLW